MPPEEDGPGPWRCEHAEVREGVRKELHSPVWISTTVGWSKLWYDEIGEIFEDRDTAHRNGPSMKSSRIGRWVGSIQSDFCPGELEGREPFQFRAAV
jgi:hypothetical protein